MRVYVGERDPATGPCRVWVTHEPPRPSLTEVVELISDLRSLSKPWPLPERDGDGAERRDQILARKDRLVAQLEAIEQTPPPVEMTAGLHTLNGYGWGGEPGGTNLAFAVLRAELGEDPPAVVVRRFRVDVIDPIHDRYELRLPAEEVWSWIEANRDLVETALFDQPRHETEADWDEPALAVQQGGEPAPGGEVSEAAASRVVQACEEAWAEIRRHHGELPDAVMILGSGVERGRLVKLGHWWAGRWIADGKPRGEVLLAGEALHLRPEEVFEVLLHEAAHGLNAARRIKDTSRGGRYHNARFAAAAEEVGLAASPMPPYGLARTALTAEARERYAAAIERLGDVMRIARQLERGVKVGQSAGEEAEAGDGQGRDGGEARQKGRALAECGCGRKLRIAPTVLAAGPVVCGLCEKEFVAEAGVDRGRFTSQRPAVVDTTFIERRRELGAGDTSPAPHERTGRVEKLEGLLPHVLAERARPADIAATASWYERFGTYNETPMPARDADEARRRIELARSILRAEGAIQGPDVRFGAVELAAGDRVTVAADEPGTGLPAHTLGTVEAVDPEAGEVEIDFATWGRLKAGIEDTVAGLLRHDYVEMAAPEAGVAGPEPLGRVAEPAAWEREP